MAGNAPSMASAFPPPPPFYKAFTPENIAAHESGASTTDNPDLEYLTPPPPPTTQYRTFGEHWTLPDRLVPLKDMPGVVQLYPDNLDGEGGVAGGRAKELKRLAKSLLVGFLELVGILGYSPSEFPPKLDDLRTILINMHHLINEYRPHQARETLIAMMEAQLERTRRETEESRRVRERAEEVLRKVEEVSREVLAEVEEEEGKVEADPGRERDMESWAVVEEILRG